MINKKKHLTEQTSPFHFMSRYSLGHSKGFSVPELLVALGLTSILAFVGAEVITNLSKSALKIDSKGNAISADQSLQRFLNNEGICSSSILTKNLNLIGKTELSFNIPTLGEFTKGIKNTNFNLTSRNIEVDNPVLTNTNALGMSIYLALLKTSFSKVDNDQSYGMAFKVNAIGTLSLMVTSSGRIVKCSLGPIAFTDVETKNPEVPTIPVVSGIPSIPSIATYPSDPGSGETSASTCKSVEQCAVYDYFLRNGIPNAYGSADAWMASNSQWKSIASSYINQMSGLAKLNFLAAVNKSGLVRTGLKQDGTAKPDTIDQWVADAVGLDASGTTMLATSNGVRTLEILFNPNNSTSCSTNSACPQSILRTALTKNPDLTMNSSLGIGAWVQALGYKSATEFANALPGAAINAALSPNAPKDNAGLVAVINYMQQNPQKAVEIANGTGLWAKNVVGNVNTVTSYIQANLQSTGNNQLAIDVAVATNQWSTVLGSQQVGTAIQTNSQGAYNVAAGTATWNNAIGSTAVTNAIASNSTTATNIAAGTNIANQIFGQTAVQQAITANPTVAAQGAQAIQAATAGGATPAQIQAYIQANPTTWQNWTPGGK